MTHFSVLVVGNDIDAALEPYQQASSGDVPREFLQFVDREDELRQEYESDGEDKTVVLRSGEVRGFYDTRFIVEGTYAYPEGARIVVGKPYREMYPTFEDFVSAFEGLKARDSEMGRFGTWSNPNGKWDWYQLGGRWSGFFHLKAGTHGKLGSRSPFLAGVDVTGTLADSCYVADIDFEKTAHRAGAAAGANWDEVQSMGLSQRALQAGFSIGPAMTRDRFVKQAEDRCCAVAALVYEGKWYEYMGEPLWGGEEVIRSEEDWFDAVTRRVIGLPGHLRVSIVDCHR